MTKKLKLAFWLTDKTLAMKIEEQAGLPHFKETGFVRIKSLPYLEDWGIYLRGNYWADDNDVVSKCFNSNEERDAYLHKVINAITDELFTGEDKLEVGEMCEVSDDGVSWHKYRLLAILPDRYEMRFIVENGTLSWCTCTYARPIAKHTEPTVEECGNVVTYIWEK